MTQKKCTKTQEVFHVQDTELSKETWKIKNKNHDPNITLKIKKKCGLFNETRGKCNLSQGKTTNT